jgi:MFS family permease
MEALARPKGLFEGLPAPFWRLWAASLVNRLGGFVVPFLALYLGDERGVSAASAGSIVGFFGAGSVIAGPLGGLLADRVGRRATIVLGMGLSAVSMIVLAFSRGTVELAVGCFFLGLCTDLPRPAVSAMVADLVPEPDRGRAYSAIYWAANLGFAFAALLAGLVAGLSFTVLFLVDAATSLACGAIVFFSLPETRPRDGEKRARFALGDLVVPFRDPSFAAFFVASSLVALVFFQFHVAMPLDMKAHGISTGAYGVLVGLNGVLVISLQPFLGPIVLRLRRGVGLAIGAALTGVGFGLLGVTHTLPGYAVAITILTLGEIAMAPVGPAVVADLAPASLRGTYQGAFHLSFSLAACVAPIAGGALLGSLGGSFLWGGCLVVGLGAAAMHLIIDGPRERRSRELAGAALQR